MELLASQAHEWGGGGPWFGFAWFAVLAVVITGAIYLLSRRGSSGTTDPGAKAVLAGRYARGEISDEEYRAHLAVLRETKG